MRLKARLIPILTWLCKPAVVPSLVNHRLGTACRKVRYGTPANSSTANPLLATRTLVRLSLSLSFFLLACSATRGQILTVTGSTSTPTPGIGHDYTKLLAETVDPASGSVSLRIKVPVPSGRGLTLPFAFSYDSNSLTLQQVSPGQVSWSYNENLFAWGPWSNTLPQLSANLQEYRIPNTLNACFSSIGYLFQDPSGARHALGLSAILSNPNTSPACARTSWSNYLTGGDDFVKATISGIGAQGNSNYTRLGAGVGTVQVADASGTVYFFGTGDWNCDQGQAVSGPQITQPLSFAMPSKIEDRNGNVITISQPCGGSTFSISDTTGRPALNFTTSGFFLPDQLITSVNVSGIQNPYSVTRGGTRPSTQLISVNATQFSGLASTCTGVPAWNKFFGSTKVLARTSRTSIL